MEKNVWLGLLLDFYGSLLTERQRRAMELYYAEDYSLAEIAEMEAITRQGVRDALQRAQQTLEQTEEKLGVVNRYLEMSEKIELLAADLYMRGDSETSRELMELLKIWERE